MLSRPRAGARGALAVAARGSVVRDRAGANLPEEECRLRTPFQRDRDRIVHSKAFRRLRHKTQVFVDPEGDHFRTRLTHTLETTGIARGVGARAAAERGSRRGDRARPRSRPPAVRARRRAGARRAAARARRPRLPPQRALAARRRAARARRARASTSPGRCATGSSSTPGPTSRRRSRGRSCASSTASRTSTTTSTTRSAPACSPPTSCPPDEIALLGDDRLAPHRHARARPRRDVRAAPATSCRATRSAARCSSLRAFMFERVYLGTQEHAQIARDRCGASSSDLVDAQRLQRRATRPTTSPA